LADEFGCYQNKESRVGYIYQQLRGAVGLVIDTGIHAKKWTREQAIEYSQKMTGKSKEEAELAIERCIAWPGQACSYLIGKLKILELRAKAQSELGDKFDLKEFHDVILMVGRVPLDLLEAEVQKYIECKR
jgi:uncharacterized protein (DUF885 family)